jgi:hypothetical protein
MILKQILGFMLYCLHAILPKRYKKQLERAVLGYQLRQCYKDPYTQYVLARDEHRDMSWPEFKKYALRNFARNKLREKTYTLSDVAEEGKLYSRHVKTWEPSKKNKACPTVCPNCQTRDSLAWNTFRFYTNEGKKTLVQEVCACCNMCGFKDKPDRIQAITHCSWKAVLPPSSVDPQFKKIQVATQIDLI